MKKHEKLTENDSIFLFFPFCINHFLFDRENPKIIHLGKSDDTAVALDAEETQHKHQHSVATASGEQSGQFEINFNFAQFDWIEKAESFHF